MDCGNNRVVEEVRRLKAAGRIKQLDGIYITHYHDDHTDQAQAMADEFHCPVYFTSRMRDILEHPEAYRMPCLTANPIRSGRPMENGATQRWNEFEFSYSYFPGQTLYHGGLAAANDNGETIFFAGDSFTPTGMDDYCLLNRNFVAPEEGFTDCLEMLRKRRGDYFIINQHVPPAFRFSPREIGRMADNFRKRRDLLAALFPWDDPNFGVDEQWARFYPYAAEAAAGGTPRVEHGHPQPLRLTTGVPRDAARSAGLENARDAPRTGAPAAGALGSHSPDRRDSRPAHRHRRCCLWPVGPAGVDGGDGHREIAVGCRYGRLHGVVEVLEREICRREQLEALAEAAGCWKDEDHPELADGAENWVRRMRDASLARTAELERDPH